MTVHIIKTTDTWIDIDNKLLDPPPKYHELTVKECTILQGAAGNIVDKVDKQAPGEFRKEKFIFVFVVALFLILFNLYLKINMIRQNGW